MNKEKLKEFGELKLQISALAERLEELKPEVLADILASGDDKVPTSIGTFSIKKLKKWKYSEKVEELKEGLDARKAMEEADGTATFTENPILEFRENKNKEQ